MTKPVPRHLVPEGSELTHDEIMTLIALLEKATGVMQNLADDSVLTDAPLFVWLRYQKDVRALKLAHDLVCRLVFRLTEGKPIISGVR